MTEATATIASFWHKSSYSGGNNECVEVADLIASGVAVRDSKDPAGPVLVFGPDAWELFVGQLRSGHHAR
jgi:hypothetical protein